MEVTVAQQRIKPDLEINITAGDHQRSYEEVYTRNGLILVKIWAWINSALIPVPSVNDTGPTIEWEQLTEDYKRRTCYD